MSLSKRKRTSSSSIDRDKRGTSPLHEKTSTPQSADSNEGLDAISRERLLILRLYAGSITITVFAFGFSLLYAGERPGLIVPTLAMALAALVTEKQSVRMNPHLELSVTFLPALFSAVVLGPISAMFVGFVSLLADVGRPWERWIIWSSSRCLTLGFASVIAAQWGSTHTLDGLFLAVTLTSVIVVVGESLIGSITVGIRNVGSSLEHLMTSVKLMGIGLFVYIPIIAGLAYVFQHVSSWAVVLFVGPVVAAQRYFLLYRQQMRTAEDLATVVNRLERVNLSFATALVTALDARDHYTAGHSAAVAVYARDTARRLNLPDRLAQRAHLCGLLHDIGKIGVPTGALRKQGPLTAEEKSAIESHSTIGASILMRIEEYEAIAEIVLHHHERYDGSGYPDALAGDNIPLLSRIVSVADAYSAMTSERPYRIALSSIDARERLIRDKSKQFDPEIVDAFISVLRLADEEYTAGVERNFIVEMNEINRVERSPSLAITI